MIRYIFKKPRVCVRNSINELWYIQVPKNVRNGFIVKNPPVRLLLLYDTYSTNKTVSLIIN